MEVLYKARVTTRDRTMLSPQRSGLHQDQDGVCSIAKKLQFALPGELLPCCHFTTAPIVSPAGRVAMWATTSLPSCIPRAGTAPGFSVRVLHSQGGTGGPVMLPFSLQMLHLNSHAQPTQRHTGDHRLLPLWQQLLLNALPGQQHSTIRNSATL